MKAVRALKAQIPPSEVFDTFERIFDLDASAGGAMRSYLGFGSTRHEVRRFVQYALDVLAVSASPLQGSRILDAGCGYGLLLVVCGFCGAESMHGVDMDATPVGFAKSYKSVLPEDIANRLHVEVGDVMRLPYEDGSFDVVTSIEAASHYLDVDGALAEIARVLRPGGSIVLSDGNNARNRRYARTIRTLWAAAEDGPGHRVIGGHAVGKPYRERREELISEHSSELSDREVARLAAATTGYIREEILEAVDAYRRSGVEPTPKRSSSEVPVDPDGATHERLFDPYELAQVLARQGFEDILVRGYWGGANGSTFVRLANMALGAASGLTISTAKGFRIRAIRR